MDSLDDDEEGEAYQNYVNAATEFNNYRKSHAHLQYNNIDMRILESLIIEVSNETLFRQQGVRKTTKVFDLPTSSACLYD
jgi:hypothetical protein